MRSKFNAESALANETKLALSFLPSDRIISGFSIYNEDTKSALFSKTIISLLDERATLMSLS